MENRVEFFVLMTTIISKDKKEVLEKDLIRKPLIRCGEGKMAKTNTSKQEDTQVDG